MICKLQILSFIDSVWAFLQYPKVADSLKVLLQYPEKLMVFLKGATKIIFVSATKISESTTNTMSYIFQNKFTFWKINLKLVSTIFIKFLFFHQMTALQKLWKMLFISSKKLISFLRYSIFCIFLLASFSTCRPFLWRIVKDKS